MTDRPDRPTRRRYRAHALAYFLAWMVAADLAVAATAPTWRTYDPVYYRDRRAAYRAGSWDLVIVGGSPAMCGVDPDALAGARWRGRPLGSAFNLGLPLGTAVEAYHAAEHGPCGPPRLLLYALTATDLNDDRLEREGPRHLMDLGDLRRWADRRPDDAAWAVGHYTAERAGRAWQLGYHTRGLRLWAAERLEEALPGTCPGAAAEARRARDRSAALTTGRGLLAPPPAPPPHRLDCLKATGRPLPPFTLLNDFRTTVNLAYLHRLLDTADERGTPVILLDLPVPADLDEKLCPKEFAEYRAVLAGVEWARGVLVLRATRAAVGLGDADFSDLIHLNADGAARLSAWLRRELEAGPARSTGE